MFPKPPTNYKELDKISSLSVAKQTERQRKFLKAICNIEPLIQRFKPEIDAPTPPRSAFHGQLIKLPLIGTNKNAEDQSRASLAHIAAHLLYGSKINQQGTLKPLQIVLISLIEDARVEMLASEDFPGLMRLWRQFQYSGSVQISSATILFQRLSKALNDPEYIDPNSWVRHGQDLFFKNKPHWNDPESSRELGGLLGNDFGQMRIPFNPRGYTVMPAYRDDNSGLWAQTEEQDALPPEETLMEAADLHSPSQDGVKEQQDSELRQVPIVANSSEPDRRFLGRYPEWNADENCEIPEHTRVFAYDPTPAPMSATLALNEGNEQIISRITRMIKLIKMGRVERSKANINGEELDLDAAINAIIDLRCKIQPSSRLYIQNISQMRDLSCSVLLDISQSTRMRAHGMQESILSVERRAVSILSEAMDAADDRFALRAFCSDGREDVHILPVKEFNQPFDVDAKARLAGLRGGLSTRLGTAIRHVGQELATQRSVRKLLIILTDGEPSDIDMPDSKNLVEDARRAVQFLGQQGVDVFAVSPQGDRSASLIRIFGKKGYLHLESATHLPKILPSIYQRLTK